MNNDKARFLSAMVAANKALATAHRLGRRLGDPSLLDRIAECACETYCVISHVGGLPGRVIDVVDGRVVDMWDEEITEVRQRVL